MQTKNEIVENWIYRYTGMEAGAFGEYVLLTNFENYVTKFAQMFNVPMHGQDRPFSCAVNEDGLAIINFGMGSPNAATAMDLLSAVGPKACSSWENVAA